MSRTDPFDCRICGAHLDSQQTLDDHKREKHTMRSAENETRASRPEPDPGVDPDLTL
jgi:hypothetical protein